MSQATSRDTALAALRANPLILFSDEQEARIADPAYDVSFEALCMDSLSRMELSIWIELELGIEVTEVEILDMASLNGLARFIERASAG